jgi:chemotaxis-related protein WspD
MTAGSLGQPTQPASPAAIHDCWNHIGVQGDSSCPELKLHVHCRNCPVYARAARALLDRDPPTDYLATWTAHLAAPTTTEARDTQSIVIFRVGSEWLALSAHILQEVSKVRPIHSIPHRRSGAVLGVANVSGELLVCVSLPTVLGLERSASASRETRTLSLQRFLIIRRDDLRLVLPVDEVDGIHYASPSDFTELPVTVAKAATKYSKAILTWDTHSVGLLDDQPLFDALQRSLG